MQVLWRYLQVGGLRMVRDVTRDRRDILVLLAIFIRDACWFHEFVLPNAPLRFLRGRIRFLGWMGAPIGDLGVGSLIAVLPAEAADGWANRRYA